MQGTLKISVVTTTPKRVLKNLAVPRTPGCAGPPNMFATASGRAERSLANSGSRDGGSGTGLGGGETGGRITIGGLGGGGGGGEGNGGLGGCITIGGRGLIGTTSGVRGKGSFGRGG